MRRSKCKSCGAVIVWAFTPRGKRIPVDAAPDATKGNLVLVPNGFGHAMRLVASAVSSADFGALHYTSHFATCPQADEHRRPR